MVKYGFSIKRADFRYTVITEQKNFLRLGVISIRQCLAANILVPRYVIEST